MTLTLTRQDAWARRKVTSEKLALMREYSGTLCGCDRCGDADLIEEQAALIQRATEAIAELGERICQRA